MTAPPKRLNDYESTCGPPSLQPRSYLIDVNVNVNDNSTLFSSANFSDKVAGWLGLRLKGR